MSINAFGFTLLASRSVIFRELGNGFREKREAFAPSDLLWWALAAIFILAAFGVLAKILSSQDKRRLYNSPAALFRELCKAHQLDRGSRVLLKQIAQTQRLSVPARLFLEVERFDAAKFEPSLRTQQAAIEQLRQKLFAPGEQQSLQG
jgi:hypothetical protein